VAAAAIVLVSLGIYFLYPASDVVAPATAPASWAQIHLEIPAAPPPRMASAPAPMVVAQDNLPILLAGSNNAPLRMDYGPGTAVPVKFEY
jgi:hypothetical protein